MVYGKEMTFYPALDQRHHIMISLYKCPGEGSKFVRELLQEIDHDRTKRQE
jgi:hypothetical protein